VLHTAEWKEHRLEQSSFFEEMSLYLEKHAVIFLVICMVSILPAKCKQYFYFVTMKRQTTLTD